MANKVIIEDNKFSSGSLREHKQSKFVQQALFYTPRVDAFPHRSLLYRSDGAGELILGGWLCDFIPNEKPLKLCSSSFTSGELWCILRQIVVKSGTKWDVEAQIPRKTRGKMGQLKQMF